MPGTISSLGQKRFVACRPSKVGVFPTSGYHLNNMEFLTGFYRKNLSEKKSKKNKERSLRERVPKRSYRSESRQGRDEDALILSDELDVDVASEVPRLEGGEEE